MKKLSDAQCKLIEEYWAEIDDYRKNLKFREWELLDNSITDTNIGGGKSNIIGNPTERKAILLAEDERYQNYKRIINAIDDTYSKLDSDLKTIVDMRYWDKDNIHEWEDIAAVLFISRNKVLRKRNLLVDKTAEKLGWI